MQRRGWSDEDHGGEPDAGFSMIATALSMLATALLVALLLGTTLDSGNSTTSSTGVAGAPGVAEADDYVAQQALTTALSSSGAAVASAGVGGTAGLSAADPSVSFTTGPSTNASTISVAQSTAGSTGDQGIPGIADSGVAGATGGNGGAGSISLADRSADGTCWVVWRSSGSATFYGAETGQSNCTAPVLSSAPGVGPVSSSAIGWQQGSFPAA